MAAAAAALLGARGEEEISVQPRRGRLVIPVSVTSLSRPNILQSADNGGEICDESRRLAS